MKVSFTKGTTSQTHQSFEFRVDFLASSMIHVIQYCNSGLKQTFTDKKCSTKLEQFLYRSLSRLRHRCEDQRARALRLAKNKKLWAKQMGVHVVYQLLAYDITP